VPTRAGLCELSQQARTRDCAGQATPAPRSRSQCVAAHTAGSSLVPLRKRADSAPQVALRPDPQARAAREPCAGRRCPCWPAPVQAAPRAAPRLSPGWRQPAAGPALVLQRAPQPAQAAAPPLQGAPEVRRRARLPCRAPLRQPAAQAGLGGRAAGQQPAAQARWQPRPGALSGAAPPPQAAAGGRGCARARRLCRCAAAARCRPSHFIISGVMLGPGSAELSYLRERVHMQPSEGACKLQLPVHSGRHEQRRL